jgi:hypothetical protein
MSRFITGMFLATTYISPRIGSTAPLPQLAPPLWPGIEMLPRMLGGVKSPSLRALRTLAFIASSSAGGRNGLTSFSVNDWRANGAGLVGNGCVGQLASPGTSDCGTGRSSIGNTGSPVLRSNTNTNPIFVACATA